MAITSNLFILFVLGSLVLYYICPKKFQWAMLLLISYAYYMYASVPALAFILCSTLSTYACGRWIEKLQKDGKTGKCALMLAMLLNLGILGVLKYTNFVITNINAVAHQHFSMVNFILPLGISYYTFQTIGYLLDVYWKRIPA